MSADFTYTTSFVLDKDHLSECFTESVGESTEPKDYLKAALIGGLGVFLLLGTNLEPFVSWFLIALGVLEGVSVYFRKAWWVYRQLMGKSGKSTVTLTISEQGLKADSFYVNFAINWQDVTALTKTKLGWLVEHKGGKNYVSDSCLDQAAQDYLVAKTR